MKKMTVILLIVLICFLLASCYGITDLAQTDSSETEEAHSEARPAPSPAATPTPSLAAPTPAAVPSAAETDGPICYGHAMEVYANPDSYAGREYASPFKIVSGPQQADAKTAYYAQGHNGGGAGSNYTVLEFAAGEAPQLTMNEVVYVRGVIAGTGAVYGDGGETMDVLWLTVSECERDALEAGIVSEARQLTLGGEKYSATSGTLAIELLSLEFTQEALMLSTKTEDTAVRQFTTYYIDILVHQDGFYAAYSGCDFWINPGTAGFDNIPLPPMDSAKDLTVEFIPFDEDGSLICEPLVIRVDIGE